MKIINNMIDIFLEVELYKNSEKGKKDKELLEKYLLEHGTSIKNEKIISS